MKKEQEIQMLKDFSDANSTSGFEEEFVKKFTEHVKDTAKVDVDGMLNVYAAKKENKKGQPALERSDLTVSEGCAPFLSQLKISSSLSFNCFGCETGL